MEFIIENGIEIPKTMGLYIHWPFKKMEVGGSFEAPLIVQAKLAKASWAHGRKHGKRFSVKKNGDKCRCWRIA